NSSSAFRRTMISPGTMRVSSGTCCGRMPIWPSTAGSVTIWTAFEYTTASGVTISRVNVLAMMSGLLRDFLDAALHVEVVFRHLVMFAVEDRLESAHGVRDRDLPALPTREDLGRAEGLTEEALNL